MDQQLQSLDPKLREAYERIMGTTSKPVAQTADMANTTSVQQPPAVAAPVEAPSQSVPSQPVQQTVAQENRPIGSISQSPFSAPPLNTQAYSGSAADNQMHAYVSQEVAGAKQSIKTIQLIYIVGGLVFFVVYILFWLKFFNIASPI